MFSAGKGVFVQIPDGSVQRLLHPGRVVAVDAAAVAVELIDSDLSPQAGQALLLFVDHKGEFVQQPGRVGGVRSVEPRAVIGVELIGKPISAESRQSYRISTSLAGLGARIGALGECRLLDVSATGFAVVARVAAPSATRLAVGDLVPADLELDGDKFTGMVSVQNAQKFDDNHARYGLYCVEEGQPGFDLQSGLLRISVYVQREQLRRLSRSA